MEILNKTEKMNLLIGLTGSVASIKFTQLINTAIQTNLFNIRVILTEKGTKFIKQEEINFVKQKYSIDIYTDQNEWDSWSNRGDPVLHIELRKWAHILLIAPLSANTLAKLANGFSDNLLSCVFRAWDFSLHSSNIDVDSPKILQKVNLLVKPAIFAPAMNTLMFKNPFTSKHLLELTNLNVVIIKTVEKKLVCGDYGDGAMAEVDDIVNIIQDIAKKIN